jgi:hypothetical protein
MPRFSVTKSVTLRQSHVSCDIGGFGLHGGQGMSAMVIARLMMG